MTESKSEPRPNIVAYERRWMKTRTHKQLKNIQTRFRGLPWAEALLCAFAEAWLKRNSRGTAMIDTPVEPLSADSFDLTKNGYWIAELGEESIVTLPQNLDNHEKAGHHVAFIVEARLTRQQFEAIAKHYGAAQRSVNITAIQDRLIALETALREIRNEADYYLEVGAAQAKPATPQFEQWCRDVLRQEGLAEWTVKPGEAYCWISQKIILFDFERYAGDYALWLHEISHALYPHAETASPGLPTANYYHGGEWAATNGRLVQKYMRPRNTPEPQQSKPAPINICPTCGSDDPKRRKRMCDDPERFYWCRDPWHDTPEPQPPHRTWSKITGTLLSCGHTEAQHMYAQSGELEIDAASCPLLAEPQQPTKEPL